MSDRSLPTIFAFLATQPDNTFVRSGGYGQDTELSLAMGHVDRAIADAPVPLTVHIVGEERPAGILPDLLYDPSGLKLRG